MIEHRSGKLMQPTKRKIFGSRRGNAIIEAALIFLPFFALIFATIDYAMVLFLQGTFKHAAREGVRFAITQRTLGSMGQKDSIKAVVQANAMGFLNGNDGARKVDIKFYRLDPSAEQRGYIEVTGTGLNSPGNIVEVTISPCVQADMTDCFRWSWMAPLQASPDSHGRSTNPLVIRARATDRMEAPPGDLLPTF